MQSKGFCHYRKKSFQKSSQRINVSHQSPNEIHMFRKKRQEIPAHVFIAKPARILAIIQLCLAFTAIGWNMVTPYIDNYMTQTSYALLYQNVAGVETPSKNLSATAQGRLQRNAARFAQLPLSERAKLSAYYTILQKKIEPSFWAKTTNAFYTFAVKTPPFELAWIFFSIALALMLLLRIEGAAQALWILPLIVAAYIVDNGLQPKATTAASATLFPSEAHIVQQYLKKPLDKSIQKQQEELTLGWQLYLIDVWSKEVPSSDPLIYAEQVENGEFFFNLARLKHEALENTASPGIVPRHQPFVVLLLYLAWNICFALVAYRTLHPKILATT